MVLMPLLSRLLTLLVILTMPLFLARLTLIPIKSLSICFEFVSVTEKLMDELAQCYNVLPQLDINNTIDHRPEGDEKWFLENEKTVTQFCRKLAAERPLK